MTGRIQVAVRDEKIVTLADVEREEVGLTCYTCGDKLAVKDGCGRRVTGIGRRNQARRKHFSHIANSKCQRNAATPMAESITVAQTKFMAQRK